jgi:hypothetical protein
VPTKGHTNGVRPSGIEEPVNALLAEESYSVAVTERVCDRLPLGA